MSSDEASIVTSIEKPRCSRCGSFKPIDELNGYDALAPTGKKSVRAYCRKLAECNSSEARDSIGRLVDTGRISADEISKVTVIGEEQQSSSQAWSKPTGTDVNESCDEVNEASSYEIVIMDSPSDDNK